MTSDDAAAAVLFGDAERDGDATFLPPKESAKTHALGLPPIASTAVVPAAVAAFPASKKRPRNNEVDDDRSRGEAQAARTFVVPQHEAGVARLSKWAARLFDPNRPKGLVQAPQTIPLNDEFLQAFGRREKETDAAKGILLQIDRTIDDAGDDDLDTLPDPASLTIKPSSTSISKRKVKITNLKYSTTAAGLDAACAKFGPVEFANLIMQTDTGGNQNTGLAYVTFLDAASAEACVTGLSSIDQRSVSVLLAATLSASTTRHQSAAQSRYWSADDLSTKCFRCGQTGHMAAECRNDAVLKPCPLCAATDHEMRHCPVRQVCFNCGVPGHVSRDCAALRGSLPRRGLCTVCYATFHHGKTQCREVTNNRVVAPPSAPLAVCLSCGRLGHYLCSELKWFFGLRGVSCSNWYVLHFVCVCNSSLYFCEFFPSCASLFIVGLFRRLTSSTFSSLTFSPCTAASPVTLARTACGPISTTVLATTALCVKRLNGRVPYRPSKKFLLKKTAAHLPRTKSGPCQREGTAATAATGVEEKMIAAAAASADGGAAPLTYGVVKHNGARCNRTFVPSRACRQPGRAVVVVVRRLQPQRNTSNALRRGRATLLVARINRNLADHRRHQTTSASAMGIVSYLLVSV